MENAVYLCDATPLCDDVLFYRMIKNTSDWRKFKVMSQKNRKDQNLTLAATCVIDVFLSSLGLCEKQMEYQLDGRGKPFFSGYGDIFFNLSHSGDYAMAAFSAFPVGCDIQKIKPGKSPAIKFLTEDEQNYLSGREDTEFFRLWSMKESIVKATGCGIPAMRTFSLIQNAVLTDEITVENKKFQTAEYRVSDGYFAAASFSGGQIPEQITTVSF